MRLLSKIGAVLAMIASALGALFLFGASKKREGRAEEQSDQREKTIENIQKADDAARDPDAVGVQRFDRSAK